MPPDNVIPLPDPEHDLQRQALYWVVRLNSGEATHGDRAAFNQWIDQSPEHRQAFFAARRLWQEIESLEPGDDAFVDESTPKQSQRISRRKIKSRRFELAAGFGLLALFGFLIWPWALRYWTADYRTEVGEIRTLHLPDGSTAHLNTDTLLALDFTENRRALELLDGEAEFEVARDPQRPFVVTAGAGRTRALGTRFVVQYGKNQTRVSVLEHAVEINSDHHAAVQLQAGYQLEYGARGLLDVPKPIAASDPDGWRHGKLKFDAQPLSEVLHEIERYLPGKILLANEQLASHEVSGVFEIKKLDRAVPAIAKSLHLQTTTIGNLLVVIY